MYLSTFSLHKFQVSSKIYKNLSKMQAKISILVLLNLIILIFSRASIEFTRPRSSSSLSLDSKICIPSSTFALRFRGGATNTKAKPFQSTKLSGKKKLTVSYMISSFFQSLIDPNYVETATGKQVTTARTADINRPIKSV